MVGAGPDHGIARPAIDPRTTPFERTAAFRRFGAIFDPDPASGEDLYTKEIIREQGFHGLPHVVAMEQLDRFIAAGEIEVYRGVTDPRHAAQFRAGDFFVGRGIFGSGMYTVAGAEGVSIAREFAGGPGGVVMRLSIKRDARLIAYGGLAAEARRRREQAEHDLIREQARARVEALARGGREAARRVEAEYDDRIATVRAAFVDIGRHAAYLGYDAVHIAEHDYYLILNRTAVRMQQENLI